MDTTLEETKDTFIKKKRNHILKRIKKHLGLVRRDPGSCQNNLPPLEFHNVHGDNIRLSRDGSLARRFESFCRALTFSSRPVRINERIYLRFSEISNNWNGGIRFGFTNNDPVSLENSLPKYACPDLTNRPGFWAKALHEQYCELDNVLHYYVNSSGDVIYGINGEEKGVILTGIDIHGLLWTVVDVYGNCTAIELLDSRLFNQQNSTQFYISQKLLINNSSCLVAPLQSLNISDDMINNISSIQHHRNTRLIPFQFHTTKGRNIVFSPDRLIASRMEVDFCQGYVFTSRAIQIDEQYVIQVLKTDTSYVGTLAFGLTSCNPDSLNQLDLPSDSNFLLDRPEYWIVSKDIASPCNKGDEISFNLSSTGEISVSKNQGPSALIMHVDHRLRLWAFFDIYGSTQSLRLFCHPKIGQYNNSLTSVHLTTTSTSDSLNLINSYARHSILHPLQPSTSNASINMMDTTTSPSILKRFDGSITLPKVGKMLAPVRSDIQIHPGGTVLVVNLPSTNVSHAHNIDIKEGDARTTRTTYVHNLESCKNTQYPENERNSGNVIPKLLSEHNNIENNFVESECTICYERNIDSVLYMCGHMCMCYDCAIEQWRGVGGGQCPLCRAVIRDVIRTYTT